MQDSPKFLIVFIRHTVACGCKKTSPVQLARSSLSVITRRVTRLRKKIFPRKSVTYKATHFILDALIFLGISHTDQMRSNFVVATSYPSRFFCNIKI